MLAAGDLNELNSLLYDELRSIADRRMAHERKGHTLQPTALMNEAYLRMLQEKGVSWENRKHFYAATATAMARILIEHARRVNSEKRGGGARRVTLGIADAAVELDCEQAAALHEALEKLEVDDERAAAVTRLRFLVGLSVEETAEALDISVRSVQREWTYARARLFALLGT
ncbi:MAG: RNA polymerase sigma-70 factor (ECF subfamily) [Planctomycetota bacterium]|jgi:RNA polymerase sigma-70 factor (ECF subfamily)